MILFAVFFDNILILRKINRMRMAIVNFKQVIKRDRVFFLKSLCKESMHRLFKLWICSPLLQDRREVSTLPKKYGNYARQHV